MDKSEELSHLKCCEKSPSKKEYSSTSAGGHESFRTQQTYDSPRPSPMARPTAIARSITRVATKILRITLRKIFKARIVSRIIIAHHEL